MSRLPRQLTASVLCALLSATGANVHARDLGSHEPLRIALVSLARQAPSPGVSSAAKLSVRRAWAGDSQALLCALTLDASGAPILDDGRFQLRRIQFQRLRGQWRVQRSETSWLPAGGSLDTACPKPGSPVSTGTQMAKSASSDINLALAEMARHPPTAGLRGAQSDLRAEAPCPVKPSAARADIDATSWKPGRIDAQGRSRLFDAPDRACPMGKHLVQHDKVRIGPSQGAWVQVQYTHPITQVVTVGWLPVHRAITVDTQVAGNSR